MAIQIKTLEQLKLMRVAGLLVADTLELLRNAVAPGVTTKDLDKIAADNIKAGGGIPSFLGYHGYPATICTSVNDEVVHGIPNDKPLKEGDVISIDCGAIVDGWHGDSAISVGVGQISSEDQKMMDACAQSMWAGIAAAKIDGKLTDLSAAIEKSINASGKYGILRDYGGHGIGTEMHQEPHLLNFGVAGRGPTLIAGMALAVEPMITRGSHKVRTLDDEWTVVTQDGTRAAHTEHSFALTPDGGIFVLTAKDGGAAGLASFGREISPLI